MARCARSIRTLTRAVRAIAGPGFGVAFSRVLEERMCATVAIVLPAGETATFGTCGG
jgi:hypothetical protein